MDGRDVIVWSFRMGLIITVIGLIAFGRLRQAQVVLTASGQGRSLGAGTA